MTYSRVKYNHLEPSQELRVTLTYVTRPVVDPFFNCLFCKSNRHKCVLP